MSLDLPRLGAILIAASLCALPAAAHDPRECRSALAQFHEHRKANENSMAAAVPILDRLAEAFDQADATGSPARRHAVIYRHFVAKYPLLRLHLSEITISSSEAMSAASRAIFCLARGEPPS